MTTQHTPGPWSLCYDGQIDGPKGEFICAFRWDTYGEFKESNNAATARLIAAAPDLLASLEEVLAYCEEHGHDWMCMAQARAAVIKAKGGAA